MSNYYINNGQLVSEDELYHYGVRGMKWGVRRATKQLSNATTKGERDAAVAKLKKHQEKGTAKMKKLQSKTAKLEKKAERAQLMYDSKAPGMRMRAAMNRSRSYGLLTTSGGNNRRARSAAKYEAQAARLEYNAMQAKLRLEKNKKMIEAFKTEIKNVDKTLAKKGRRYING